MIPNDRGLLRNKRPSKYFEARTSADIYEMKAFLNFQYISHETLCALSIHILNQIRNKIQNWKMTDRKSCLIHYYYSLKIIIIDCLFSSVLLE